MDFFLPIAFIVVNLISLFGQFSYGAFSLVYLPVRIVINIQHDIHSLQCLEHVDGLVQERRKSTVNTL